ncbi:hypothetical protein J2S78_003410 [Salibacterium salarium]|uniref:hypothetical protein n=1 Tax=Salibacterium salarium TaxID=284579 RepID=UPI002781F500|nr:hypothetical protein [Salibacterium salarium]MDQ0300941.1 hypothetical protein [Salibacterium salarium]
MVASFAPTSLWRTGTDIGSVIGSEKGLMEGRADIRSANGRGESEIVEISKK